MRGTVAAIILGLLMTTGCASTNQMTTQDQNYNAPLSIYSAMDSTSLVYSDPMAASHANDLIPWPPHRPMTIHFAGLDSYSIRSATLWITQ